MRIRILFWGVLFITACSGPKALFNGQDLNGWTNYGTELWYVDNGTLVAESGPDKGYGYFCTDDYFQDFDISLEFKLEANGNSGLFIRSTVDGTKVSGWQVEIAPEWETTGGVYESYGRGWLIKPDQKEGVLRLEDWNLMRVVVKGPELTSWLNGEQMVNITDEKIGAGEGGICLQIHDGGGIKVRFRNIQLKKL